MRKLFKNAAAEFPCCLRCCIPGCLTHYVWVLLWAQAPIVFRNYCRHGRGVIVIGFFSG